MWKVFRSSACSKFYHIKPVLKVSNTSVSHALKITKTPQLNLVTRHKYFSTAAVQTNSTGEIENPSIPNPELLAQINQFFSEIDRNAQNRGRVDKENVNNVISLIKKLGQSSRNHGLYLLRSCELLRKESPSERIATATKIWNFLQSIDTQFETAHFNALLKVYVNNSHEFSATEFLKLMESHKVEPNKATLLYILDKYCNDGDISGASEILEFLKEKKYAINEDVFNVLIKGHMKAKDEAGAKEMFDVMRSSNLTPSAESYTALACGYAELGDTEKLKSTLTEGSTNGMNFSNAHYFKILSCAANEQVSTEVLYMLKDLMQWRQEALNCALDLVHKNMPAVAFALCSTVDRSCFDNQRQVIIRQMIRCERDVDEIIKYCEEVFGTGGNDYIFINCGKCAVDCGKIDHAFRLFEASQNKGIPVRFQSISLLFSGCKDEESIFLILNKMSQLGIPVDYQSYLQYVFPAINTENAEEVIQKIQATGQSSSGAFDPLFCYYCYQGEFDKALLLIEKYPVEVRFSFDIERTLQAHDKYSVSSNSENFLKVLSHILKDSGSHGMDSEVKCGKYLAHLVMTQPRLFQVLHEKPFHESFAYSPRTLRTCRTILKDTSPQSLAIFEPLDNKLNSPAMSRNRDFDMNPRVDMSIFDRLTFYLRERDVEKVQELTEEMDRSGIEYPPTLLSRLLLFYSTQSDLEKAEKVLKTLKAQNPSFKLDSIKVLEYAVMLINFGKYEEAARFVREECDELLLFGNTQLFTKVLRKLLNSASQTGDETLMRSLHESLVKHCSDSETVQLLHDSLMKLHLIKNDLKSAVAEFKQRLSQREISPHLHSLLRICTLNEDTASLDEIIDSLSLKYGTKTAYFHLIIAFLECGRKTQAVKLIQTLGPKATTAYLEDICFKLYQQKKDGPLEDLVLIANNLEHINKEKLFLYLIKSYDEKKDFKKIQAVCKMIKQDRIFEPSHETTKLLEDIYREQGQPAPFGAPRTDFTPSSGFTTPSDLRDDIPEIEEFRDCLNKKDAVQALDKLQKMKKGFIHALSESDMRDVMELLLRNNLIKDFSSNVQAMSHVIERSYDIVRPLLEKLSDQGEVEMLRDLQTILPEFSLRKLSFKAYLGKSYIQAGRFEELLSILEQRSEPQKNLFTFSAFMDLLNVKEYEDRCVKLAKGYLQDNFDIPIACVWAHYFKNEEYDKARELFQSYSVPIDKVDSLVLKSVREKDDVNMAKEYVSYVDKIAPREKTRERAYGTLLELYVAKDEYDAAVELVQEANRKSIELGKYHRSTLTILKEALQQRQKEVPFTIPPEDFILPRRSF